MSRPSRGLPLSAFFVSFVVATTTLAAADPPVWKFTPGAANRFRLTQDMAMTMNLGVGGDVTTNTKNIMDMSWTVAEVRDDGSAIIKQKINRIRMSMQAPGGAAAVEFDTQSTDEPQGFAAMIAPLLREMARAEFTVTMTPRGKITNVEVPDSLVQALAAAPGAALMGDMATAEGFKKIASGVAFELPESLEPGDEWTATTEMTNPVLGKQTVTMTYRYVGPKDVDGVTLEAFTPSLEISFAGTPAAQAQVTEQQSSGEMLFNRNAGRIESSQLDHTMKLDLTVAGQKIAQSLTQKVKFQWQRENAE